MHKLMNVMIRRVQEHRRAHMRVGGRATGQSRHGCARVQIMHKGSIRHTHVRRYESTREEALNSSISYKKEKPLDASERTTFQRSC